MISKANVYGRTEIEQQKQFSGAIMHLDEASPTEIYPEQVSHFEDNVPMCKLQGRPACLVHYIQDSACVFDGKIGISSPSV
jgi:hypothetical protein